MALFPQILTGQNLVNPMMDSALRRGPLLRLKNGELKAAVGRFRHLLQAVEARSTKQLRQTLAEVLLRGKLIHGHHRWSISASTAGGRNKIHQAIETDTRQATRRSAAQRYVLNETLCLMTKV